MANQGEGEKLISSKADATRKMKKEILILLGVCLTYGFNKKKKVVPGPSDKAVCHN